MGILHGKKRLRIVLITPFVVLTTLSAGVVGIVSFHNGRQAVNEVTGRLQVEVSARIIECLRSFLDLPRKIVRINADAISRGSPAANDSAALEQSFREQIRTFDSVTSVYFGNADGGLVNSGREPGTDMRYVIHTHSFASGRLEKFAIDGQGSRTELLASIPDFDARTRPWYALAAGKGDTAWSPIYILSTGQDMAIACSRPVYDAGHALLGVVSVDVFLGHISRFLQTLKIGDRGQCFIMERSGLLIASSADGAPFTGAGGEGAPHRILAAESSSPAIRSGVAVLNERLGGFEGGREGQRITFDMKGDRFFLELSPFLDEAGLDWLIGVVVSESDFLSRVEANNRDTLLLIALALMIVIATGLYAAQRINRPILLLHERSIAIAKGEWTSSIDIDSSIAEVDGLARSFDHMASRLRSMLEDLSHEVAMRLQVEAALRESEEHYRQLFESLRDAAFVHLLDEGGIPGRFILVNEEACRRLGYSREELYGMTPMDLGTPETADMQRNIAKELDKNGTALFEIVHVTKDNRHIHVESNVRRVTIGGRPLVLSVSRDITERRQAEKERLRIEQRLQHLNKMESLGRMAGAIAHHINNLLSVVIGNIELALGDLPPELKARKGLAQAMKASWKAVEIGRYMLTYLGQTPGKREPLDLGQVISQAQDLLERTIPAKVRLQTTVPPRGPIVRADRAHMEQIHANLASNALEAIGEAEGLITVAVEVVEEERICRKNLFPLDWKPVQKLYACLSVSDTGPGLDEDTTDRVFDPFFTTRFTGRGLGLPVVLGIARGYEGAITIESQPGKGALFRVYLPILVEQGESDHREETPSVLPIEM